MGGTGEEEWRRSGGGVGEEEWERSGGNGGGGVGEEWGGGGASYQHRAADYRIMQLTGSRCLRSLMAHHPLEGGDSVTE